MPTTRMNFSGLEAEILLVEGEDRAGPEVDVHLSVGSISIVVTVEAHHAVVLGANLMNAGTASIANFDGPPAKNDG
jgi:hypothetical protein